MKKTLLTCALIVSGVFSLYAQFDLGGVKVNVGNVCKTQGDKKLCLNPQTGQWMVTDGTNVVGGNTNTGAVGGTGSVGGVQVNGSLPGMNGQGTANGQNINGLTNLLALMQNVLRFLGPFLIGLAVVAFFWYIVLYIWKGKDSPEDFKKGKAGMFYALLAIFIMVSIWGIITLVGNILGIAPGGSINGFVLPGEKVN